MKRGQLALIVSVLIMATPGAAFAGDVKGDVKKGREVARQHCTRCHIVGDLNSMGIGSTPSFQYMVNHIKEYREKFQTFYSLRPHPAFMTVKGLPPLTDIPPSIAPVELTLDDVENIAAYAETLKEK